MLAEKFVLYLEALKRNLEYPDGSPRVQSTSPHVPFWPQIRLTAQLRVRTDVHGADAFRSHHISPAQDCSFRLCSLRGGATMPRVSGFLSARSAPTRIVDE